MSKPTLKDYLRNPQNIILGIVTHYWFLFTDKTSIKIQYRLRMGRKLNLKNPTRFSEKIQWLKLYNRKPEYTTMVDKIAVKDYVAKVIGDRFIIPTLGVWNSFDEIDFNSLPDKFVLKTNHSGGSTGVVICKDKSRFNKKAAKRRLEKSMKEDFYHIFREWPYKNVPHKIFAEVFLEDNGVQGLLDYKFYCFNGEPKVLLIASNRFTTHNFNYFDMDFNPLPIISVEGKPVDNRLIRKPDCFYEMKSFAKALAQGQPHIRVDLYEIGGKVYFGEMTFYDSSGFDNLNSDKVDLEWGSWITLPLKNTEKFKK